MKRILVIAILISYSLTWFGISINYFYCCGKLKTVSLITNTEEKKHNKLPQGCCQNKKVDIKLKGDQKITAQKAFQFEVHLSPVIYDAGYIPTLSLNTKGFIPTDNYSPPIFSPSKCVLYCVYRI